MGSVTRLLAAWLSALLRRAPGDSCRARRGRRAVPGRSHDAGADGGARRGPRGGPRPAARRASAVLYNSSVTCGSSSPTTTASSRPASPCCARARRPRRDHHDRARPQHQRRGARHHHRPATAPGAGARSATVARPGLRRHAVGLRARRPARRARARRPGLVVAGVNVGANMGADITYSGTVGAAFEGALRGLPALAVVGGEHGAGWLPRRPAAARHRAQVIAQRPAAAHHPQRQPARPAAGARSPACRPGPPRRRQLPRRRRLPRRRLAGPCAAASTSLAVRAPGVRRRGPTPTSRSSAAGCVALTPLQLRPARPATARRAAPTWDLDARGRCRALRRRRMRRLRPGHLRPRRHRGRHGRADRRVVPPRHAHGARRRCCPTTPSSPASASRCMTQMGCSRPSTRRSSTTSTASTTTGATTSSSAATRASRTVLERLRAAGRQLGIVTTKSARHDADGVSRRGPGGPLRRRGHRQRHRRAQAVAGAPAALPASGSGRPAARRDLRRRQPRRHRGRRRGRHGDRGRDLGRVRPRRAAGRAPDFWSTSRASCSTCACAARGAAAEAAVERVPRSSGAGGLT